MGPRDKPEDDSSSVARPLALKPFQQPACQYSMRGIEIALRIDVEQQLLVKDREWLAFGDKLLQQDLAALPAL